MPSRTWLPRPNLHEDHLAVGVPLCCLSSGECDFWRVVESAFAEHGVDDG